MDIKQIIKDAGLNFICDFLMFPTKRIVDRRCLYGPQELRLLHRALLSQNLFGIDGPMVTAFEKEFAKEYGLPFAVASTSGTAAIHTALGALGLNPGDEIITAPITDMGTIAPILFQQCVPVFADVDKTFNMDPGDVQRKITSRTKAIVVVHLFGNPCHMSAMLEVARQHKIPLIEDCSQAHKTLYQGQYVGTIGDIGCFSFQQSKHMTTGDGGMCITSNKEYYEHMKLFVDKGFARKGWGSRAYLFLAPNYRMNELTAAVGRAQLKKVDAVVKKRHVLGDYLTELIGDIPGLRPAPVTAQAQSSYWLYPLYVEGAHTEAFTKKLVSHKIGASFGYTGKPIYLCSEALVNKYREGLCPQAEDALKHLVCIPLDESWDRPRVKKTAEIIRDCFNEGSGAKREPEVFSAVSNSSNFKTDDKNKINVAIIGCGQMGKWHLDAYKNNPKVKLVAFVDTDINKANAYAQMFNARAYDAHTQMLQKERIQAVSLCTVPSTHKTITLDLLNAGIHVLCEKPLGVSLQEAQEMVRQAKEQNRHLITAFKFRFFEEVTRTKDILQQKGIGRVLSFRLMFGGYINMSKTWYADPSLAGGGVLMDNGAHAFDLIRYLLGEINEVSAQFSKFQDLAVEDTVQVRCSLANGTKGVIDLSWSLAVPSKSYLEIYGEEGTVLLEPTGVRYKFRNWDDFKYIPNQTTVKDAFVRQIDHFVNAVGPVGPVITTLEDGLKAQALIDQTYALKPKEELA